MMVARSLYKIYALYSRKIDRVYIGQTQDLDKRLQEHLEGVSIYTKRTDDWVLIYTEEHQTRGGAMKREKQLKSARGRKFLRDHIAGGC